MENLLLQVGLFVSLILLLNLVLKINVVSLVFKILFSPLFFFMKWLGQENILFTRCKEGTVKAVMRGDSFERFIMSFAGYHLNDPTKKKRDFVEKTERYRPSYERTTTEGTETIRLADWEVLYHGVGNLKGFTHMDDRYYDDRPRLLKHLGLYWVGWPWANSIYVYQFEWNETFTDPNTSEEKLLPRAEATDFIFVADFVYAIKTVGAETRDRLPTDELTLVTIAVRNPYRALFSGEDWMQRITAAINRHVRNFVGNKDYQDLISPPSLKHEPVSGVPAPEARPASAEEEEEEKVKEQKKLRDYWAQFSQPIMALNKKLPDDEGQPSGLMGRYGVEIRTADLQSMDLSGTGKIQHQAAATRAYVATQEAEAKRLGYKADAEGILLKGKTESESLRKRLEVIKEFGEAGKLLAGLDAIQSSAEGPNNTIIWANNPLGSLSELLKPEPKGEGKT